MIFDQWDVALFSFPFVDRDSAKKRPTLVLSAESFNRRGVVVTAMITTAAAGSWPDDVAIVDLGSAGLRHPSFVRWKVFTLDVKLSLRRLGALSEIERLPLRRRLADVIP